MEDVVGVGGVHVYKECILGTVDVCVRRWMEDVVGVGGVHVYKECILGTVDVCVLRWMETY
jgi:hypothetical protein